ncbi:MAG: ABC transporter permease [Saprospiraceae bacterium]|nr:ABC transporter permease [Saprospiraceae bacterium]
MIQYIKSEIIKCVYVPIIGLIGFSVFSVIFLVFLIHYVDVESIMFLGKNPWIKLWNSGAGFMSVFTFVPLLILLISAVFHIENQNNTWKQLFTVPVSKRKILLSKLSAIFILIFTFCFLIMISIVVIGWYLNHLYPESEFSYYPLQPFYFIKPTCITLINALGVIGIQFFLSLRFRNFLAPMTLGLFIFIVSFLIGVNNTPLSHYFPHAYTLIGQDLQMFTIDKIGIVDYGLFNSIQVYSVSMFLFFISMAIYLEEKRSKN